MATTVDVDVHIKTVPKGLMQKVVFFGERRGV
jgi:hypothetical protein